MLATQNNFHLSSSAYSTLNKETAVIGGSGILGVPQGN